MSKIRLLGNRVALEVDLVEDKTKSGILIPSESQLKATSGLVVAVGTGKMLTSGQVVPVQPKLGERVHYQSSKGTMLDLDDKALLILDVDDLRGVYK